MCCPSPRRLGGALALGVLLFASQARADSADAKAAIGADLLSYYRGERTAAWIVFGLGAAAAGTGGALVTRDSDFARGAGWPLLGFGVLEALGAIVYSSQVGAEIDHYQALLAKDPAGYRKEELAHLQGTTDRFVYYRLGELALAVGGTGALLYGAIGDHPLAEGLGTGLVAIGLPFFVIDTFNNDRARRYADQLRAFHPALGVRASDRGLALILAGTF